jgi:hypothetical protein
MSIRLSNAVAEINRRAREGVLAKPEAPAVAPVAKKKKKTAKRA